MKRRIEVYRVVSKLLMEAELSDKLAKKPYITDERFKRGSERHLWQFLVEVEKAQSIPPEFQLINFSELSPNTNEDLHGMITFLRSAIGKARLVPKVA